MPFTQSTVLGRKVLLNDWQSFHRDCLLSVLYTLRDAGNEDGITLDQIRDLTGLHSPTDIYDLVQSMLGEPTLLRSTIHSTYVITPRGIRWVEESPCQP